MNNIRDIVYFKNISPIIKGNSKMHLIGCWVWSPQIILNVTSICKNLWIKIYSISNIFLSELFLVISNGYICKTFI